MFSFLSAMMMNFSLVSIPRIIGAYGFDGNFFVWLLKVVGRSILWFLTNGIYLICKWLLALVDFLQYFVQKLIGLDYWLNTENYTIDGATDSDLLFKFLYNDTVQKVFQTMVALFVVLLIIFTIFQIIRSEWQYVTGNSFGDGSGNSKASIFRAALKAILIVIIFPIMLMAGILSSNAILASIVKALNIDMGSTFGSTIFYISSKQANRYRIYASGNARSPISDEVSFYMVEVGGDWVYLKLGTNTSLNSKTLTVDNYKDYYNIISAEGTFLNKNITVNGAEKTITAIKKYSVHTMFDQIDPVTSITGFCFRLNKNGKNYYFVAQVGSDYANTDKEAVYYYLKNVLGVTLLSANNSAGNDDLHAELKFESKGLGGCYIKKSTQAQKAAGNEAVRACYNTWNYAIMYSEFSSAFSDCQFLISASTDTSFLIDTFGLGVTNAGVLINSDSVSEYFDGGQIGMGASQAEYNVMADVIDFVSKNDVELYVIDMTSNQIKWDMDDYSAPSKYVAYGMGTTSQPTSGSTTTTTSETGSGSTTTTTGSTSGSTETSTVSASNGLKKIKVYENTATQETAEYATFVVDYSDYCSDTEYGPKLYFAKSGVGNELEGSKYIMCYKVQDGTSTKFVPLLNGKTFIDPQSQKQFLFKSDYLSSSYKGVVLAKGIFDGGTDITTDLDSGTPTYFKSSYQLTKGKNTISLSDLDNDMYYYKITSGGSVTQTVTIADYDKYVYSTQTSKEYRYTVDGDTDASGNQYVTITGYKDGSFVMEKYLEKNSYTETGDAGCFQYSTSTGSSGTTYTSLSCPITSIGGAMRSKVEKIGESIFWIFNVIPSTDESSSSYGDGYVVRCVKDTPEIKIYKYECTNSSNGSGTINGEVNTLLEDIEVEFANGYNYYNYKDGDVNKLYMLQRDNTYKFSGSESRYPSESLFNSDLKFYLKRTKVYLYDANKKKNYGYSKNYGIGEYVLATFKSYAYDEENNQGKATFYIEEDATSITIVSADTFADQNKDLKSTSTGSTATNYYVTGKFKIAGSTWHLFKDNEIMVKTEGLSVDELVVKGVSIEYENQGNQALVYDIEPVTTDLTNFSKGDIYKYKVVQKSTTTGEKLTVTSAERLENLKFSLKTSRNNNDVDLGWVLNGITGNRPDSDYTATYTGIHVGNVYIFDCDQKYFAVVWNSSDSTFTINGINAGGQIVKARNEKDSSASNGVDSRITSASREYQLVYQYKDASGKTYADDPTLYKGYKLEFNINSDDLEYVKEDGGSIYQTVDPYIITILDTATGENTTKNKILINTTMRFTVNMGNAGSELKYLTTTTDGLRFGIKSPVTESQTSSPGYIQEILNFDLYSYSNFSFWKTTENDGSTLSGDPYVAIYQFKGFDGSGNFLCSEVPANDHTDNKTFFQCKADASAISKWGNNETSLALYDGKNYVATIYKNKGDSCTSIADLKEKTTSVLYNYKEYDNIQSQNYYTSLDNVATYYKNVQDSYLTASYRDNMYWTFRMDFMLWPIWNARIKFSAWGSRRLEREEFVKSNVLLLSEGVDFDYFFDGSRITLDTFYQSTKIQYLIIFISSILIIKVLGSAIWGVIKRFYEITLYFLAAPAVASMIPINENVFGERIVKPLVSKVLSTYGVIIGLNVFFILLVPIESMSNIFTQRDVAESGSYFMKNMPFGVEGLNLYVYLLFLLVAFTMIEQLPGLVQSLIGTGENIYDTGKKVQSEAGNTMKTAIQTASGQKLAEGVKNVANVVKESAPGQLIGAIHRARKNRQNQIDEEHAENANTDQKSRTDEEEEKKDETTPETQPQTPPTTTPTTGLNTAPPNGNEPEDEEEEETLPGVTAENGMAGAGVDPTTGGPVDTAGQTTGTNGENDIDLVKETKQEINNNALNSELVSDENGQLDPNVIANLIKNILQSGGLIPNAVASAVSSALANKSGGAEKVDTSGLDADLKREAVLSTMTDKEREDFNKMDEDAQNAELAKYQVSAEKDLDENGQLQYNVQKQDENGKLGLSRKLDQEQASAITSDLAGKANISGEEYTQSAIESGNMSALGAELGKNMALGVDFSSAGIGNQLEAEIMKAGSRNEDIHSEAVLQHLENDPAKFQQFALDTGLKTKNGKVATADDFKNDPELREKALGYIKNMSKAEDKNIINSIADDDIQGELKGVIKQRLDDGNFRVSNFALTSNEEHNAVAEKILANHEAGNNILNKAREGEAESIVANTAKNLIAQNPNSQVAQALGNTILAGNIDDEELKKLEESGKLSALTGGKASTVSEITPEIRAMLGFMKANSGVGGLEGMSLARTAALRAKFDDADERLNAVNALDDGQISKTMQKAGYVDYLADKATKDASLAVSEDQKIEAQVAFANAKGNEDVMAKLEALNGGKIDNLGEFLKTNSKASNIVDYAIKSSGQTEYYAKQANESYEKLIPKTQEVQDMEQKLSKSKVLSDIESDKNLLINGFINSDLTGKGNIVDDLISANYELENDENVQAILATGIDEKSLKALRGSGLTDKDIALSIKKLQLNGVDKVGADEVDFIRNGIDDAEVNKLALQNMQAKDGLGKQFKDMLTSDETDEIINSISSNGFQSLSKEEQDKALQELLAKNGGAREKLEKLGVTDGNLNDSRAVDVRAELIAEASKMSYYELKAQSTPSPDGENKSVSQQIQEEIDKQNLIDDVLREGVDSSQVRAEIDAQGNDSKAGELIADYYAEKLDTLSPEEKEKTRQEVYEAQKKLKEDGTAESYEEFMSRISEDDNAMDLFNQEVDAKNKQKNKERLANGGAERIRLTSNKIRENDKLMKKAKLQFAKENAGADLSSLSELEQQQYLYQNFADQLTGEDRREVDMAYAKQRIQNAPGKTKLADSKFRNARNLVDYANKNNMSIDEVLADAGLVGDSNENLNSRIVKNLSDEDYEAIYNDIQENGTDEEIQTIEDAKRSFVERDINESYQNAEKGQESTKSQPVDIENISGKDKEYLNKVLKDNGLDNWDDLKEYEKKLLLDSGEVDKAGNAVLANPGDLTSDKLQKNINNLKSKKTKTVVSDDEKELLDGMFGVNENYEKAQIMLDVMSEKDQLALYSQITGKKGKEAKKEFNKLSAEEKYEKLSGSEEFKTKYQKEIDMRYDSKAYTDALLVDGIDAVSAYYAQVTGKDNFKDGLSKAKQREFVQQHFSEIYNATDEYGEALLDDSTKNIIDISAYNNSRNVHKGNSALKAEIEAANNSEAFTAKAKALYEAQFGKGSYDPNSLKTKAFISDNFDKIKDSLDSKDKLDLEADYLMIRGGRENNEANKKIARQQVLDARDHDMSLDEYFLANASEGDKKTIKAENAQKEDYKKQHAKISNGLIKGDLGKGKQEAIMKDGQGNIIYGKDGKAKTMSVSSEHVNADGTVTVVQKGKNGWQVANKMKSAERDEFGRAQINDDGSVKRTDKFVKSAKGKKLRIKTAKRLDKADEKLKDMTDAEIKADILLDDEDARAQVAERYKKQKGKDFNKLTREQQIQFLDHEDTLFLDSSTVKDETEFENRKARRDHLKKVEEQRNKTTVDFEADVMFGEDNKKNDRELNLDNALLDFYLKKNGNKDIDDFNDSVSFRRTFFEENRDEFNNYLKKNNKDGYDQLNEFAKGRREKRDEFLKNNKTEVQKVKDDIAGEKFMDGVKKKKAKADDSSFMEGVEKLQDESAERAGKEAEKEAKKTKKANEKLAEKNNNQPYAKKKKIKKDELKKMSKDDIYATTAIEDPRVRKQIEAIAGKTFEKDEDLIDFIKDYKDKDGRKDMGGLVIRAHNMAYGDKGRKKFEAFSDEVGRRNSKKANLEKAIADDANAEKDKETEKKKSKENWNKVGKAFVTPFVDAGKGAYTLVKNTSEKIKEVKAEVAENKANKKLMNTSDDRIMAEEALNKGALTLFNNVYNAKYPNAKKAFNQLSREQMIDFAVRNWTDDDGQARINKAGAFYKAEDDGSLTITDAGKLYETSVYKKLRNKNNLIIDKQDKLVASGKGVFRKETDDEIRGRIALEQNREAIKQIYFDQHKKTKFANLSEEEQLKFAQQHWRESLDKIESKDDKSYVIDSMRKEIAKRDSNDADYRGVYEKLEKGAKKDDYHVNNNGLVEIERDGSLLKKGEGDAEVKLDENGNVKRDRLGNVIREKDLKDIGEMTKKKASEDQPEKKVPDGAKDIEAIRRKVYGDAQPGTNKYESYKQTHSILPDVQKMTDAERKAYNSNKNLLQQRMRAEGSAETLANLFQNTHLLKNDTMVKDMVAIQTGDKSLSTDSIMKVLKKNKAFISRHFANGKVDDNELRKIVSTKNINELISDLKGGLTSSTIDKYMNSNEKIKEQLLSIGAGDLTKSLDLDTQVQRKVDSINTNGVLKKMIDDYLRNKNKTDYKDDKGSIKNNQDVQDAINELSQKSNIFKKTLNDEVLKNVQGRGLMSDSEIRKFFESVNRPVPSGFVDRTNPESPQNIEQAFSKFSKGEKIERLVFRFRKKPPKQANVYDNWNAGLQYQIKNIRNDASLSREEKKVKIEEIQNKLIYTHGEPEFIKNASAEVRSEFKQQQAINRAEAFKTQKFSKVNKTQGRTHSASKSDMSKFSRKYGFAGQPGTFTEYSPNRNRKVRHLEELQNVNNLIDRYKVTKGAGNDNVNFGSNFAKYASNFFTSSEIENIMKKVMPDSKFKGLTSAKDIEKEINNRKKAFEDQLAEKLKHAQMKVNKDNRVKHGSYLDAQGLGFETERFKKANVASEQSKINTNIASNASSTQSGSTSSSNKYGKAVPKKISNARTRMQELEIDLKKFEDFNRTYKGGGSAQDYATALKKALGDEFYKNNRLTKYKMFGKLENSPISIQQREIAKNLANQLEKAQRRINSKSNIISTSKDISQLFVGKRMTNAKTSVEMELDSHRAKEIAKSLKLVQDNSRSLNYDALSKMIKPQFAREFERTKQYARAKGNEELQKKYLEEYLKKQRANAEMRVHRNGFLKSEKDELKKYNGTLVRKSEVGDAVRSGTRQKVVNNGESPILQRLNSNASDAQRTYELAKARLDSLIRERDRIKNDPRTSRKELNRYALSIADARKLAERYKNAVQDINARRDSYLKSVASANIKTAKIENQGLGINSSYSATAGYNFPRKPAGPERRGPGAPPPPKYISPNSPEGRLVDKIVRDYMASFNAQLEKMSKQFELKDKDLSKRLYNASRRMQEDFGSNYRKLKKTQQIFDEKLKNIASKYNSSISTIKEDIRKGNVKLSEEEQKILDCVSALERTDRKLNSNLKGAGVDVSGVTAKKN